MDILKGSTVTIKLGPFVNSSNQHLTNLANTMVVYIAKNGGSLAPRHSTTAITYDSDGFYNVELDGTDNNTLGFLLVEVVNDAVHLPVWDTYNVIASLIAPTFVVGDSNVLIDDWGGQTANCYVNLTDASSFILTGIYENSAWTAANTIQMAAAIIEATRDLDTKQYVGHRYYYWQYLEFPRRLRATFPWNNTIPASLTNIEQVVMKESIRRASCWQALYILRNKGRNIHLDRQNVGIESTRERVGPIDEAFTYKKGFDVRVKLCPEAMAYMNPYMIGTRIIRGGM